jgi:lipopolysaccharide transport system ATP-binding protein
VSAPAIRIDGLSKRYRIGTQLHDHGRLTEVMWDAIKRPFQNGSRDKPEPQRENAFWALRDVSLEVEQGDVLGVVGRNGAGKTTLLKILSRVTEPTEGSAELNGQVSALLEVGTGFHPELTGRENIFLNGGILGMSRSEIKSKFGQIVEFAEIERFIDTPVKRYSSGMFVRLAFAVAAHLEPEVLIVDEVLAVGDVNFQRKCLGKMEDVAKSGRTVLFVSHNTGAIAELCTRAILLEAGQKVVDGSVPEVLARYAELMSSGGPQVVDLEVQPDLPASITDVRTEDAQGGPNHSFDIVDPVAVVVRYEVTEATRGLQLALTLTRNSVRLVHTFDTDQIDDMPTREPGVYEARWVIPPMFLKAGLYTVGLMSGTPERLFQELDSIISFEVDEYTLNAQHRGYRRDRPGHVVAPGTWSTARVG